MNQKEKKWYMHFLSLKKFVEEYNRFPTPYEIYDGFNIGIWCQNQIKKYKNEKLTDTQLKCLENIGFSFTLKKSEELSFEKWQERLDLLLEYRRIYNRMPNKDVVYKDVPLGKWWRSTCVSYSTKSLSDRRRQLLEENDVIGKKNKWILTYMRVKQHVNNYNQLPTVTDNSVLYNWLRRQGMMYRKGNLEAYQIIMLRELSPKLLGDKSDWYNMYTKVKEYKKEHGHLPQEKDNLYLFDWLEAQQTNKFLSAEQTHLLKIVTDD